ncbi:2-hydroxyacid dehydrogenase [Devosia sp. I507]|uniref:2-hydroxyacid dehydrogenase n=1 Tax=Devosia sp. I507 TaxID=2083786 RepID=UPI000CE99B0F|nr:2-hydroxyacid dehydrogenase [Devosia sp. I507]AVF04335.1 dihydrofolate reductase [Devosia sp. I507]
MRHNLLLLSPVTDYLASELGARYDVHRWYDAEDREALLANVGDRIAAVVAGGHIGLPAAIAAALPRLEIVALYGVGYDAVDLNRAREHGYRVAITPDVLTEDVADLTATLGLATVRRIGPADAFVRRGHWGTHDFGLSQSISATRFGIYGMGKIGQAVARRLVPFGCSIAYCSRQSKGLPFERYPDLPSLARQVDVLIVTAASTPETRHSISSQVLAALGPSGHLVNVARGALVDQTELFQALRDGRLGGAALDVFEVEPVDHIEVASVPNLLLTPHIGSATHKARRGMADMVIANLDAYFQGNVPPGEVRLG